jgi:hypothetical protein
MKSIIFNQISIVGIHHIMKKSVMPEGMIIKEAVKIVKQQSLGQTLRVLELYLIPFDSPK